MESVLLAALEKGGPWAVIVVLVALIWQKEIREEKGVRDALRDLIASQQLIAANLVSVMSCLQAHDERVDKIERDIIGMVDALRHLEARAPRGRAS